MLDIYRRAKAEASYDATIVLGMVSKRGGLSTAQYLINTPKPSDGYETDFSGTYRTSDIDEGRHAANRKERRGPSSVEWRNRHFLRAPRA